MKKGKFLILGILVLVFGMMLVMCDDDSDSSGGGGSSGGTVEYYPADMADRPTDFSFAYVPPPNSQHVQYPEYSIRPLSDLINGSASITISGDKVNVNLGTPKDGYLYDDTLDDEVEEGIVVNPRGVKGWGFEAFCTSDVKYGLICVKKGTGSYYDRGGIAGLFYADRDLTAKGTYTYESSDGGRHIQTVIYNVSLKKGWNYFIESEDKEAKTTTYTSSASFPSGFTWLVADARNM